MVRSAARVWMVRMTVGFALILGEGSLGGSASARTPRISPGKAMAELEITLRVHDYAHMSAAALSRVESEATRVLLGAGMLSRWNAPTDQEPQAFAVGGVNPRIPLIDVYVLPEEMASKLNVSGRALGYSLVPGLGEPPSRAAVFYTRALEMAKQGPAAWDQLLGYAIAHELGHLLLRSAAHSDGGIMRALWGPGELEAISQGRLEFDVHESIVMRAALAARSNVVQAREETMCARAPVPRPGDGEGEFPEGEPLTLGVDESQFNFGGKAWLQ